MGCALVDYSAWIDPRIWITVGGNVAWVDSSRKTGGHGQADPVLGGEQATLLSNSWETAPVLGMFRGTSLRRKQVSRCFWGKPRAHGVQVVASSNLAAPTIKSDSCSVERACTSGARLGPVLDSRRTHVRHAECRQPAKSGRARYRGDCLCAITIDSSPLWATKQSAVAKARDPLTARVRRKRVPGVHLQRSNAIAALHQFARRFISSSGKRRTKLRNACGS